ncbi:MAG: hypothetical protein ACXWIU_04595, partial [Limisphaerales bacterium]
MAPQLFAQRQRRSIGRPPTASIFRRHQRTNGRADTPFIPPPTNAVDLPIYATSKLENGDPFFLVRNGKRSGPYGLPVYNDPRSVTAGKIL